MVGSDWRQYELLYNENTDSEFFRVTKYEFVYAFIVYVSKSIHLDFWHFTIIVKLVGYFVFLKVYKEFALNYWGLVYWYPFFSLFLWIDHPSRNFLAIIFFTLSIPYIYKKNFRCFLLFVLLGSGCHNTCLALIPLYFYVNYRKNNNYLVDLAIIIITYFFVSIIRPHLDLLFSFAVFSRLESYSLTDEYLTQMPISVFLLIVTSLYIVTKHIDQFRKNNHYADFILKCAYFYAFFYAFANMLNILFRLPLYLIVPYCVAISFLAEIKLLGFSKLIRLATICVTVFYLYHNLTRDDRYVPYSNYCEYLFQTKPSYTYRSNYNNLHSPYRK